MFGHRAHADHGVEDDRHDERVDHNHQRRRVGEAEPDDHQRQPGDARYALQIPQEGFESPRRVTVGTDKETDWHANRERYRGRNADHAHAGADVFGEHAMREQHDQRVPDPRRRHQYAFGKLAGRVDCPPDDHQRGKRNQDLHAAQLAGGDA